MYILRRGQDLSVTVAINRTSSPISITHVMIVIAVAVCPLCAVITMATPRVRRVPDLAL